MILKRDIQINIHDIQEQYGHFLSTPENDVPIASLIELAGLMVLYSGAMKGISTQLEVLDDEFQIQHKHNPIHHLECRLKRPASIYRKLEKHGLSPSADAVREHIHDIAGIRVICNFLNDIYAVEDLLLRKPDIKLLKKKDYISQPKANGYRSLHLVVTTPVFLSDKREEVPVEIQLRTMAMDYWASLEHMLRYKNAKINMEKYSKMLLDCANSLADTEEAMQHIRNVIEE